MTHSKVAPLMELNCATRVVFAAVWLVGAAACARSAPAAQVAATPAPARSAERYCGVLALPWSRNSPCRRMRPFRVSRKSRRRSSCVARASITCVLCRHLRNEQNHQGVGNLIIEPFPAVANTNGQVQRRQRLDGLLNHHYREAA